MAFFGLTALGPQNTFAAKEIHFRNIQIFSEEDYEKVWNRVNGRVTYCSFSKVDEMMRVLFHGPVPVTDKPFIDAAFDDAKMYADEPDLLSFTLYMKVMMRLGREAEEEEKALQVLIFAAIFFNDFYL